MAKEDKILTIKKGAKINVPQLKEQDVGQQRWMAIVDAGIPYSEVLKPAFWTHVAYKFQKFAKIHVQAEDGTYYAELLVVVPLKADTVVKELIFVELDAVKEPGTAFSVGEFDISFHGPNVKWRVSRDKKVLKDGFSTSNDAKIYAVDYTKAMSKAVA